MLLAIKSTKRTAHLIRDGSLALFEVVGSDLAGDPRDLSQDPRFVPGEPEVGCAPNQGPCLSLTQLQLRALWMLSQGPCQHVQQMVVKASRDSDSRGHLDVNHVII